jgi:alpha-mannosidase
MNIDWHEKLKMLKLSFPLDLSDAQSTTEIPYGTIQRVDDGGEEPCQSWVDLSGTVDGQRCGLALLNDCKYGYDVRDAELRMSILRSPVYALHRPRQIEEGVTYHYTDQGEQTVHLALVPHAGPWYEGDAVRRAQALNTFPLVAKVTPHAGEWPAAMSFVECTADNIVLTTLKCEEARDSLILRGYETTGHETECQITAGPEPQRMQWSVTFKPHEIKTWRLDPGTPPVQTNLLEEVL